MAEKISIEKIGIARTCFPQKFGVPRQAGLVSGALAKIQFEKQNDLSSMLDGLSDYSHIWLLWWFDKNTNKTLKSKVSPPKLDGEKKGVFATRSPHRPNPIGLSVVKLLEVRESYLLVDGIDLVDGTPILDIKPYLPHIDGVKDANATWANRVAQSTLTVNIPENLELKISEFEKQIQQQFQYEVHLKNAMINLLKNDPRPIVYKEKPYKDDYRLAFYHFDIQFVVENECVLVKDLVLR